MTISINDNFPNQELRILIDGEVQNINSADYFLGKKIVLVGVPGAFTPTCHLSHLPGYTENLQKFKDKGYSVTFIAVNDPFVMKAWCDANKAGNDILFLADGNASLSKSLGLTFDGSMYSLGLRSQRFAMILTGLKVEKLFIEKPGVFDVSSAQKVLGHLS